MKLIEIIQSPQLAAELIRRWIVLTLGLIASIVVAYWIANQQLAWLAGSAAVMLTVLVGVGMQRQSWLLILVGWSFTGFVYALKVPFSLHDMAIMLAACSYVTYRVVTGRDTYQPWGLLKSLVVINCAHVLLTFVVHPAGLHSFGTQTMGARPYFDIFLAACAFWVIVHLPESYKTVSRIPLWLLAGATLVAMLNLAVYIYPPITRYVLPFYGGIDYSGLLSSIGSADRAPAIKRFQGMAPFGLMLVQILAAYYPLRSLFNPLRARCYLFLLGLAAVLAGGYRNLLLYAVMSLALASWFRRGWRELVLASVIGTLFLGILIAGQGRLYRLPMVAQRALAFLPGQWAETVKEDVTQSSEGRFAWWRQVISEGVIKNWWIGDGFAISENDYNLLAFSSRGGTEWFTVTGMFHNGPLSTIRYTGIVGLILFYVFMIASAVYSVKCVHRCRGTPLFPVAIFLAVQLVWIPVHFTFLFGSYNASLTNQFFLVGILCLVMRMAQTTPAPTQTSPGSAPVPVRSVVYGAHL